MPNGDNNAALSRSAGFLGGFANSFSQARAGQAKAAEEAANRDADRAKWEASNDLMRELKGAKTMSGQELMDYGRGLGVDEKTLTAAFQPGREYEPEAARAWITQAGSLKKTGQQQAGANKRNAATVAAKGGVNKAIPMDKYLATAMAQAAGEAGIPKGVPPGDPSLPKETQDLYNNLKRQYLAGQVKSWENSTGQSSGLDYNSPYADVEEQWNGWKKNQVTPGQVFTPKAGGTMVQVKPKTTTAPGPAPTPGAKPLSVQDLPRF